MNLLCERKNRRSGGCANSKEEAVRKDLADLQDPTLLSFKVLFPNEHMLEVYRYTCRATQPRCWTSAGRQHGLWLLVHTAALLL